MIKDPPLIYLGGDFFMGKVQKLVLSAIYVALAVTLSLIEIPFNGIIPLKLDLSDLVIVIGVLTLGLWPSLVISIFRFLFRYLIIAINLHGAIVGLYAEGVALLCSILIIMFTFCGKKIFHFKAQYVNSIFIGIFSILMFIFTMVLLNFLFITPTFFSFFSGEYKFIGFLTFTNDFRFSWFHGDSLSKYFTVIISLYGIFNFIKGLICIGLGLFIANVLNKTILYGKNNAVNNG